MHYCQQAVCYNAGRMPAESSVGFSSVHTRANICETPHYSKPPTVMANPKKINTDKIRIIYRYFEKLDYLCSNKIRIKYG